MGFKALEWEVEVDADAVDVEGMTRFVRGTLEDKAFFFKANLSSTLTFISAAGSRAARLALVLRPAGT